MRAAEVVAYFRVMPPLTGVGHARHAFALHAQGQIEAARAAAREAWYSGILPQADEDRLLALFGASLSMVDHDRRMETLLPHQETESARQLLPHHPPHQHAADLTSSRRHTAAANIDILYA